MSSPLIELKHLAPERFADCLEFYLSRLPFDEKRFPLDDLSDFTRKVLLEALNVEWGTTITYSELAVRLRLPKAVRAVASALGRNPYPFVIPCHRILPRGGGVGGYAWGMELKAALLAYEKGC